MHPTYYRGCWHVVSRCLFLRYRHEPSLLEKTFSFRTKAVYNPRAFILHAEWLDQACAHCPKFPTAASRRSLGRVSVPVWLVVLSDQLQIVGLVSLYPTNYLICHRPLQSREVLRSPAFIRRSYAVLATLSRSYPPRLGTFRCITHPFATRHQGCPRAAVRLACVKHAASVQSEPGSNSSVQSKNSQRIAVVPNLNGHLGHQSSNLFHYRASTSIPLHPNSQLATPQILIQTMTSAPSGHPPKCPHLSAVSF